MSAKEISNSGTARDNEVSKSKIESIDLRDEELTEEQLEAVAGGAPNNDTSSAFTLGVKHSFGGNVPPVSDTLANAAKAGISGAGTGIK